MRTLPNPIVQSKDLIIILTFHGLYDTKHPSKAEEPEMWLSRFQFESLLDELPSHTMLTFDDGFTSCIEIALPALLNRSLTAKFFVCAGQIGKPGHLTENQLREIHRAGMEIGTHGFQHRPWSSLDKRTLKEEVFDAKEALEQMVGAAINEAACPFGVYNRRILSALRHAGVKRVFTSDRLPARQSSCVLPRYTLRASETLDDWVRIIHFKEPRLPWFRLAKTTLKRWG